MSIHDLLDGVEWKFLGHQEPGETPHATHSGVLRIGDVELRCYQLSNGQRVFDSDDVDAMFPGWREMFGLEEAPDGR